MIKKFFEEVIEFDDKGFIEVRIFDNNGKYSPFSKYAKSYKGLLSLLREFNNKRWNLYYGINKRVVEGRKNIDVEKRSVFYFDIEDCGKKPPLTDKKYYNQLIDTLNFVSLKFRELYNVDPVAAVCSGRGVHLYFKFYAFDNIKYKQHFRKWFKYIQSQLMIGRPHKNIKFTDSVFDGSRIAGLPGSINTKYDESPLREVIFIKPDNMFDLRDVLDKINVREPNRKKVNFKDKNNKYNDSNIRKSPEYKLLTEFDNLPDGQLHVHIVFALKLLLRDNNISGDVIDEIRDELIELEYSVQDFNMPGDDYTYSEGILNNWCTNNYEWCVDNDVKLPYNYRLGTKKDIMKVNKDIDFPDVEIKEFNTLISYVRLFNEKHLVTLSDNVAVCYDYLFNKLKKCCEPKLWKFVLDNKLFNNLCVLT